ncbi:MAG: hypothetical protein KF814_12030 [Nitrospiraceae bacterium]|nr:hypothetical protein [Nitrospiraceae bacterium]
MSKRVDETVDPLSASAKLVLDDAVQQLDRDTTLRLQRARMRALEGAAHGRPWLAWAGGLVLASAAILTVVLWEAPTAIEPHSHMHLLEDLDLVTSTENVEISEDLEFYDWLADATSTIG